MKRTSYICILLAGALWGITGFFFRHLTALGFGSMEAVVMRIGLAAVLLFLILLVKEPSAFRVRMKDLWCMVGAGTACLMMFICYFKAMEYASLAVAVVLLYTAPGFAFTKAITSCTWRWNQPLPSLSTNRGKSP